MTDTKPTKQNKPTKPRRRQTEKSTCACGAVILKYNLKKHYMTKKHAYFIQTGKIPVRKVIDAKYYRDRLNNNVELRDRVRKTNREYYYRNREQVLKRTYLNRKLKKNEQYSRLETHKC
jgi:hypothetical protein